MSKYNKCQNLTCFLLDVKASLVGEQLQSSEFQQIK